MEKETLRILVTGVNVTPLARVLDWMLERGHEVWYVGTRHPYTPRQPERFHFTPSTIVAHLPVVHYANLTTDRAIFDQYAPSEIELLRLLAAEFRPHIVHAFGMDFMAECCAQAGLQPFVVSSWGYLNTLVEQKEPQEIYQSYQNILSCTSALVVESPKQAQTIQERYGDRFRVLQVIIGVDGKNFSPRDPFSLRSWRAAFNLPEEATVFLSPRGWGNVYNQPLIVEAIAQVHRRLPQPALLAFVKLSRNARKETGVRNFETALAKAEEAGLKDFVRWLPEMPYQVMPTVYALSNFVINYPASDAFPMTLIEAVACEKPVISADLPSYRGAFIEEFCTLAPPNDPQALAEAILATVKNPPSPERLRQGRQAVIEQYDEAIAKKALFELYDSLV